MGPDHAAHARGLRRTCRDSATPCVWWSATTTTVRSDAPGSGDHGGRGAPDRTVVLHVAAQAQTTGVQLSQDLVAEDVIVLGPAAQGRPDRPSGLQRTVGVTPARYLAGTPPHDAHRRPRGRSGTGWRCVRAQATGTFASVTTMAVCSFCRTRGPRGGCLVTRVLPGRRPGNDRSKQPFACSVRRGWGQPACLPAGGSAVSLMAMSKGRAMLLRAANRTTSRAG